MQWLLSEALRLTAGYESWVLAAQGPDYRRQCLAGWDKVVAGAEAVPGHWLRLAVAGVILLPNELVQFGP